MPEATEKKGNLIICDLCQKGTKNVHDLCVMSIDAKSYVRKTPERCLHDAHKAKIYIYLEAFLQQHQHCLRFVVSIEGLMGVEAEDAHKRIASRLKTKWQQPYSRTCGYVNSSIANTSVWSTHWCNYWYRVPGHRISVQSLNWDDESTKYFLVGALGGE